jgi:hypothetical protein
VVHENEVLAQFFLFKLVDVHIAHQQSDDVTHQLGLLQLFFQLIRQIKGAKMTSNAFCSKAFPMQQLLSS